MSETTFSDENADFSGKIGSVTLTLDDGSELECDIAAIFPAGKRQYIALTPDDDSDGEFYLYRYIDRGDDEEPEIENIEDDEEYELAADAFDELLDEVDFDAEN